MTANKIQNMDKVLNIIENSEIYLVSSLPTHTGGKFLCSLLDSHPELYVMPCSIHKILPWNEELLPDIDELFDRMKNDHVYYSIYNQLKSQQCLEKIKALIKIVGPSLKNYVLLIVYFFHRSKNIYPTKNIFVIHTHDISKTETYLKKIKNSQLLGISRHPANVTASYIKKYLRSFKALKKPLPYFRVVEQFNELTLLSKIKTKIGIIILEELHANPRQSLENLCKYISIKYDQKLNNSTLLGEAWVYEGWKGKVSGFNKKHKKIDHKTIGRIGELYSFKCTGAFQEYIGYSTLSKLKYFERILTLIPERAFFEWYKWSTLSLIKYISLNRINHNLIMLFIKYLIRHYFFYPLYKFYEMYFLTNQISKKDINANFNKINILNKLDSSSVEVIR